MNAKELIRLKRDGEGLSTGEIRFLVAGAADHSVPEYQVSAFLMATFFRGMTPRETADLALAMLESGERLDFDGGAWLPADKHSTGGVGDKLSFLVAPLVAAAGVPVPMISGRSLGHTGGTLDKLESIPGLRTQFSPEELRRQLASVGCFIAGQSDRLAPADAVLYALRDAASIVESVPLITGSILSKKAAAGVRGLALDVKVGRGAFMRDSVRARELAESLVAVGARLGLRARAHLTPMDLVLGYTAGNALEIAESVRALRGEKVAADVRRLTLTLGGSMLELVGAAGSVAEGSKRIAALWDGGHGLEKFRSLIEAQGGDPRVLDDTTRLPAAPACVEIHAVQSGRLAGLDARSVGEWITEAGGGRLVSGQAIDPRVGVELVAPVGSMVREGDVIFWLHLSDAGEAAGLQLRASDWIVFDSGEQAGSELEPAIVEPPGAD